MEMFPNFPDLDAILNLTWSQFWLLIRARRKRRNKQSKEDQTQSRIAEIKAKYS